MRPCGASEGLRIRCFPSNSWTDQVEALRRRMEITEGRLRMPSGADRDTVCWFNNAQGSYASYTLVVHGQRLMGKIKPESLELFSLGV